MYWSNMTSHSCSLISTTLYDSWFWWKRDSCHLKLQMLLSLRLGLEMFAPQPMWPVLAIDHRPWWVHRQKVTKDQDLDIKLGIWFDCYVWNLEFMKNSCSWGQPDSRIRKEIASNIKPTSYGLTIRFFYLMCMVTCWLIPPFFSACLNDRFTGCFSSPGSSNTSSLLSCSYRSGISSKEADHLSCLICFLLTVMDRYRHR